MPDVYKQNVCKHLPATEWCFTHTHTHIYIYIERERESERERERECCSIDFVCNDQLYF